MKYSFALLAALCIAIPAWPHTASALTLVEDGESQAPIIVFEDAPPFIQQATDELAEYIERTTGARPEVIEGAPEPIPAHAIWVGYQPAMDSLFPEQDFDFEHPEEILIAANENHLAILGRDRWDPDHLKVDFPQPPGGSNPGARGVMTVNGVQKEYGTVNAVYTFLQKYLDVRWLWPGELGIDVIERDTIEFEPFAYRYHPQIRDRSAIFNFSGVMRRNGNSHQWTRFQRLQLGSLWVETWHAFNTWYDRFHETHPEYFAMQPDGTRGGWPSAGSSKLCVSNPGVAYLWLHDEVTEQLKRNPNKQVFNAAFNDGSYQGFCICEGCRSWDHQDGELMAFAWSGVAQRYVSMTDRYVTFTNKCAELLERRYPNEDYYVSNFAYGNTRPAPVEARPADNVIFAGVFNFHNRHNINDRTTADEHKQMFLDWASRDIPNFAWRPNLGAAAGWQLGMPNVAPRRVIEDFRLAAENGVMSISFDSVWETWPTQGPHYYMMAQMAWNPYADGEAILQDYYKRAFGPAVEPMTEYWELMARTSDEIVYSERPQSDVWDEAFYERAYAHLTRAAKLATDAPGKYAKRVAYVRAGLDYMRLYYDTKARIAELRESNGEDAEAEAAARKNWQRLSEIFDTYPDAFPPGYFGTPTSRYGLGRMRRIHPDYYDTTRPRR